MHRSAVRTGSGDKFSGARGHGSLFAATEPSITLSVPVTNLFYKNDITLTTSYAGSPHDYATALELIRSRRVRFGEMITHRLSLAETGLGFQLVAAAQESMKVIIEPQR